MARFSLHPGCPRRAAYNLSIAEPVEEEVFDPEVGKPTDNPFPEGMTDYNLLTVVELRGLCSERGLPTSGNKSELVARLEGNDASDSTEAPAEEAAVEEEEVVPAEAAAAENTEEGEVSESGGESSGTATE